MKAFAPLLLLWLPLVALAQENPPPAGDTPPHAEQQAAPAADEAPASQETVQTVPVKPLDEEPEQKASKDAVQLDTIEVTASKHIKAQRDIPGSVGAIRGEALEKMHAQSMADYLKLVPGVALSDYGSGQQIPVIRGIASSSSQPGTQFTAQTTGIFLEDIPFGDLFLPLSVPDLNPFDLERVEVLKGPQGTLFGSSALAGAVRYIVQKPVTSLWQAKFSTTLSQTRLSEGLHAVEAGAINVPLFRDAALRVVGVLRDEPGLYDSVPNGSNTRDEKDVDRLKQWSGRALASWDAWDTLKVSAMYFKQHTYRPDVSYATTPTAPERNDSPFPGPATNDFGGGNLGVSYDFDWAHVLYSGNTLNKKTRALSRLEHALPEQLGNQQDTAWENVINGRVWGSTHELRLSSPEGGDGFEWLFGAAYLRYKQHLFQFEPNPGPANSGYYANPPENEGDVPEADRSSSFLYATVDSDGFEEAVFGEATQRLGEHVEVTLGGREFHTHLVGHSIFTGAQIVALSNPPGQTQQDTTQVADEKGFNPKFALRYLHDRNIQTYLLAAKGFQFGGFQANPPLANLEQATESKGFRYGPYKSSKLWNYEAGVRTEWLDRKLRFDVAGFYLDWTDLQLTIRVPLNPVPLPGPQKNVDLGVIVNVAGAHSEGVEATLQVLPFDGAAFTSAVAWITAVTDEPFDKDNPAGPVPAGTRLPGTPDFTWSNVFSYEHSLPYFSTWEGGWSLTHVHLGEAVDDMRALKRVMGYDTLDAQVSLSRPQTAWLPMIDVGVRNITDVRGVSAYAGDGAAMNAFYFTQPRTVMLSLGWKL